MKVLFVASEVSPYAKSGGLGDVIGSLPKELKKLGADVRVVFPRYKHLKKTPDLKYVGSAAITLDWRRQSASVFETEENGVNFYLIENDYYFGREGFYGYGDDHERFAFFSKAAIEILPIINFVPDVIHFHDWQTGVACVYLKDVYKRFKCFSEVKTLFTIHNLQYQGCFGREVMGSIELNEGYFVNDKLEFYGNISLLKAGLTYADMLSTVSETYALEIQTPEFGYGLDGMLRSRKDDLHGIVNGIDYDLYNPETDSTIFKTYSHDDLSGKAINKRELQRTLGLPVRDDVPVVAVVSRLVDQKGFDILSSCIHDFLARDVQFVVIGVGDGRYEYLFRDLANRFPDKVSANIFFDDNLARQIYAGSDIFLMPSLFEPCGLGQIIAMRYGTIPVARKTGGLSDTIEHYNNVTKSGTGFLFEHYMSSGLMWALSEALSYYNRKEDWNNLIQNAMRKDFSWHVSAKKYISLYEKLTKK
ncbi:MAG: glycogen synthase GlgA [Clostridiales bacterium]|jgi:starch synthase|nr:glycogen synthase GlgA [Clostridiales bacterium]